MRPVGPLMKEHRLIERMIDVIERETEKLERGSLPAEGFLGTAIDFFRFYADRTHHGKEEDILFADLGGREISDEHRETLDELLQEHEKAREMISSLERARVRMGGPEKTEPAEISSILRDLTVLYREHIEKEDKHFFLPVMDYYSDDEEAEMLGEFEDFDRKIIHEKYESAVERLER